MEVSDSLSSPKISSRFLLLLRLNCTQLLKFVSFQFRPRFSHLGYCKINNNPNIVSSCLKRAFSIIKCYLSNDISLIAVGPPQFGQVALLTALYQILLHEAFHSQLSLVDSHNIHVVHVIEMGITITCLQNSTTGENDAPI